jgi:hypothetical protein
MVERSDRMAGQDDANAGSTRCRGGGTVAAMRCSASLLAVPALLASLAIAPAVAAGAGGDIGHRDGSFAPLHSPSGTKPESKLWFNHGWGAVMFDRGAYRIAKLNATTGAWSDTGVAVDPRDASRADVLWDGRKLYVASHVYATTGAPAKPGSIARLYRYSYNAASDGYTLDPGYPAKLNASKSETLVIDKDSTGTLWATWTEGSRVYVAHTTGGNDAAWGAPYVVPGPGTSLTSDDISSLVHFGSKIGVMWSNQTDGHFYFSVHDDGAADSAWSTAVAPMPMLADDHINLKADAAGRVYAAVKAEGTAKGKPLNMLLIRSAGGSWSALTFGMGSDSHTRPIVVLDEQVGVIHMLATCPQPPKTSGQSGGDICEKTASMANPSFAPGVGTPVIREAGAADMNDVTSTKQDVDAGSGLVAVASNATSRTYWHMQEALPAPSAVSPPQSGSKSGGKGSPQTRSTSRIRLRARPGKVWAGRRTRVIFTATVLQGRHRVAVRGAIIRFAGHRIRTSRSGRARISVRLRHAGHPRAVASKRGLLTGATRVVVARVQHAAR